MVMKPGNPLDLIKRLASDEATCEIEPRVFPALRACGLDSDDLREIIDVELGESHCFKSKPTEKHYPGIVSDYYSIWVDECGCVMFLKILVIGNRLVITSFKRDDRYA